MGHITPSLACRTSHQARLATHPYLLTYIPAGPDLHLIKVAAGYQRLRT